MTTDDGGRPTAAAAAVPRAASREPRAATVALAGGVGGAKLASGLYADLPPDSLSVVVNTADDAEFHGLHVSPDLDTVLYTLAGLANPPTGWGIAGDTFACLDMLGRYGEPTWFKLGDRDLATHIVRTHLLRSGRTLTDTTARLAAQLGVRARILPMCDEPVATVVGSPAGDLAFQEYFVKRHQADDVRSVRFAGIEQTRPTAQVLTALREARAVVLCPSNPIVSIGPILAVPGLRAALRSLTAPRVAVSPIVGGQAVSGPAGRMLAGLGHEVSALGVARLYRDVIHGIVIDERDAELAGPIRELGLWVAVTQTVMTDADSRRALARVALDLALDGAPR